MSLFTSDREKRLWFWTLVVMVAIYSTLGVSRTIVDALRERDLLGMSVGVAGITVGAAILWQALKKRPGWREVGVALAVGLAYWMAFLRVENAAERSHLLEYGIVAALIHQALQERARNGRPVSMPSAMTVGITALLGLVDEAIQAVLPSRVFDWNDVGFNAIAGFMVVAARLALEPVRTPGWRLWFMWSITAAVGWGWATDPSTFGESIRFDFLQPSQYLTVPPLMSVAAGAMVAGAVQWVLLRPHLKRPVFWFVASFTTVAVGGILVLVGNVLDPERTWALGVLLFGLAIGVAQWLVLRREFARAVWWIPMSALGWLVSIPIGDETGPPGWAIYGAITGAAIVWLVRQRTGPDMHLTESDQT